MATKKILVSLPTGTWTASVHPRLGGSAINASPISGVALAAPVNVYGFDLTESAAGVGYLVAVSDSGGVFGIYHVDLEETNGSYWASESPSPGETVENVEVDLTGIPPISITIPAAVVSASQSESTIAVVRGDTLRVTLPLMGNLTGRKKLEFTVKQSGIVGINENTSSIAILHVTESGGLDVLNASGSGLTSSDASLTVQNVTTGEVILVVKANITSALVIEDSEWDCQWVKSNDEVASPIAGAFSVTPDVSQAVA